MKSLILATIVSMLLTLNGFAHFKYNNSDIPFTDDQQILLPSQNLKFEQLTLKSENNFLGKYGKWTLLLDKHTGAIQRAFGEPILLNGLHTINKDNIITAANSFLDENSSALNFDFSQLKLTRANEINNRWYVSYKQYYKGIEVLLSKAELRFFNNGNLSNFSLLIYPISDLNIDDIAISPEQAQNIATLGLKFNPLTDVNEVSKQMYILPYKNLHNTVYRLVYHVEVITAEPFAHYFTYIDAQSGQILWRQNKVINLNSFSTTGEVKENYGFDIPKQLPFADMEIYLNSQKYTTDAEGKFNFNITDSAFLVAKFQGPWSKVTLKNGLAKTTNYQTKIAPNEDINLIWDDKNSHSTERNLFYHANYVHDYVKMIDPDADYMDFQLDVTVDFNGNSPNAYSSGKAIGYIGVNNTTMRLPEVASVMYHEYGHSVNALLYQSQGATNGMINISCNEGHADLFSTMIQDEPRMGLGAWTNEPDKIIRTLKNDLVYPDNIQPDGHYNGQILGGAFWDLKEATNLDYVRHLSHFTKYGLPDDPDVGKAFSEWFIETLNTDDDDGNLTNGTPNISEIITAFNRHKIGTNLFLQFGFDHEQHPNTDNISEPYIIDFTLQSISIEGSGPDSVMVIWTNDNYQNKHYAIAQLVDESKGLYHAEIPAQPAGTTIKYHMSAWEPISKTAVKFYKQYTATNSFAFIIGYESVHFDNFETESGWKAKASDDDATRGIWENDKPNKIDLSMYNLGIIQPGENFSKDGQKCWVTGAKGTTATFMNNMPNGQTSLISPTFDLTDYFNPIIKYQKWFYNIRNISIPGYETKWLTSISFDDGLTWKTISQDAEPTIQWEETYVTLKEHLPADVSKFKIKFVFDAPRSNQMISIHEGLIDDFEILDIKKSLLKVEDDFLQTLTIIPNPFTNTTTISFDSKTQDFSTLEIYNLLGIKIKTIQFESFPGMNTLVWDGSNDSGERLPQGLYIFKLINANEINSGKVILE